MGIANRLKRIEAARGDPTEKLQGAVAGAAQLVRGSWLIFLLVGLYLAILGATTTHELLFKSGNLDVPLLNVGVPVVHFYVFAPFLFLILHAHLLLQVYFLSRKAHALDRAISGLPKDAQDAARTLIFPGLLVEMLIGHARSSGFRLLLRIVNLVSLCILPPLLLLWLLLSFLPYQAELITMLQRLALLLDLILIWFLWPRINHPDGWGTWLLKFLKGNGWISRLARPFGFLIGPLLGTAGLLAFATLVAIIPLGPVERALGFVPPPTVWLFDPKVIEPPYEGGPTGTEQPWLARRLSLPGRTLVASEPAAELVDEFHEEDDPQKAAFAKYAQGLDLRGRSLRGADLSGATITRPLLEGADLREANLYRAELVDAELCDPDFSKPANCAKLDGSSLEQVVLDGSILREAELQGAELGGASLQGADLWGASLQGADLVGASLQGANLVGASLQGANLAGASLQGADLDSASLQGANLGGASLQGADLRSARLQGANLRGAGLWNVDTGDFDPDLWRLADLRWAAFHPFRGPDDQQGRFAPPTSENIEAWRTAALDGVEDAEVRARVSEPFDAMLEVVEGGAEPVPSPFRTWSGPRENLEGDWETASVLLPTWFAAASDAAGPGLMRSPVAPLALQDEEALGDLLGDLACGDGATPETAEGIAGRIDEQLWLSSAIVAERMLGDDCPAAEGLDEEVRAELRAFVDRKDELRNDAEALDAYYAGCEAPTTMPGELCGPEYRPEPPPR